MPSRAYTSFLQRKKFILRYFYLDGVSMPSRAYTSFLRLVSEPSHPARCIVSMPSRAYTSFLPSELVLPKHHDQYVSMPSRAYTSFLRITEPSDDMSAEEIRVNALSGLYLISTVPLQKPRFYAVSRACFCRYLSEYSDNSRFSCMLTFWTYLMRCTYP